jgi:NAD(P)-dependent dehydrogenase (short-subunit alcohol dehydrogenase family)
MATKAWLVIGTRSGIGLEIARQLSSAEGNEVFGSFYERLSFFGGDVGKTLLCE